MNKKEAHKRPPFVGMSGNASHNGVHVVDHASGHAAGHAVQKPCIKDHVSKLGHAQAMQLSILQGPRQQYQGI